MRTFRRSRVRSPLPARSLPVSSVDRALQNGWERVRVSGPGKLEYPLTLSLSPRTSKRIHAVVGCRHR